MPPTAKRRKAVEDKYKCLSCDSERVSSSFPDYNPTANCKHLINICTKCLKEWVALMVEDSNFIRGGDDAKLFGIPCPECGAVMKNSDVEGAATKKVYQKFEAMERRHIADNTPGWRWCLAPGCKAGQVHEVKTPTETKPEKKSRGMKKDDPEPEPTPETVLSVCNECGAKACVACDRPWHEGETCNEFQLRTTGRINEEDKALAAIRKMTKPCPSCKRPIEKNGGCPAMYCSQCHIPFCWNCHSVFVHGYCKCHPPPVPPPDATAESS